MPVFEVRVDRSRLMAKLKLAEGSLPDARRLAMIEVAKIMVKVMSEISPRDTNRYVRGWLEAGHGAGVQTTLPPLKPSKVRDQIIANLTTQAAMMQGRVNELEARQAKLKKAPSAKFLARMATARKRLDKAEDALKRFVGSETALALMRKFSYVLNGNNRHISPTSVAIEVKDEVYGGSGFLTHSQSKTVLNLHNREPHSNAVENRKHVLQRAKASVAASGPNSMGITFIQKVRAKAGIAKTV